MRLTESWVSMLQSLHKDLTNLSAYTHTIPTLSSIVIEETQGPGVGAGSPAAIPEHVEQVMVPTPAGRRPVSPIKSPARDGQTPHGLEDSSETTVWMRGAWWIASSAQMENSLPRWVVQITQVARQSKQYRSLLAHGQMARHDSRWMSRTSTQLPCSLLPIRM